MASTRDFSGGPPPPDPGLAARLFFSWVNPLVSLGFSKRLESADIWESRPETHAEVFSVRFRDALRAAVARAGGGTPSLFDIVWGAERASISYTLWVHSLDSVGQILRPVFLGQVITALDPSVPLGEAMVWALLLLAASLVVAFAHSHYTWESRANVGLTVQGGLSALVVDKCLRLPEAAKDRATEINLVSTDAQIMMEAFNWGLRIPGYALITVSAAALLLGALGWAALAGLAVLAVSMLLQWRIGRRQSIEQERKQAHTDERLRHLKEAVAGIHTVKYHAWERGVSARVSACRERELVHISRFRALWAVNECLSGSTIVLAALAALGTHALRGDGSLDPTTVFSTLALFNLLREPVQFVPLIASAAVKGVVSGRRIARYLAASELALQDRIPTEEPLLSLRADAGGADAGALCGFAWQPHLAPALHGSAFALPRSDALVVVVGPVGSGKSTLLASLLGETCALGGAAAAARGSVSYVPQQAWIMNATLRENVIVGGGWDAARYRRALAACALDRDVGAMEAGDATELGEHGRTLSGGQMQRVSLARAAYAQSQIVLLDDPLSALDQSVAKQVFDGCICGEMRGRARVLVTHYLHLLPRADHVVLMRGGRIEAQGTLAELNAGGVDVGSYVDEDDAADVDALAGQVRAERRGSAASIDDVRLDGDGYSADGGSVVGGGGGKEAATQAGEEKGPEAQPEAGPPKGGDGGGDRGRVVLSEHRGKGSLGGEVFRTYAGAFGGAPIVGGAIVAFGFVQSTYALTDWWLARWSAGIDVDLSVRLGVYAALAIGNAVAVFVRALFFAHGTVRAVRVLHERLLGAILRAPLLFFDQNPSGRIANRFAGDVSELEDILPHMLEHAALCFFHVLMVVVTIAALMPWYLVVLPPMLAFFYTTMQYYRASMRELARFYSTTKSPIFAIFGEIVDGRASLRAYGLQPAFFGRWCRRFNLHARFARAMFAASVWQHLRLQLVGTFLSFGAAVIAVLVREDIGKSLGGLIINFSLVLSFYLTGYVWLSTESEAHLTAVERMHHYAKTPPEAPEKAEGDPAEGEWPTRGDVVIRDLVLRYRPDLPPALKGASLHLPPGIRCGIVGRTGAGKSTLSSALFRVVEPESGAISVDGADTLRLGLHTLRSRLTVIPQTPHLFAGSLRYNLDPDGRRDDAELLAALDKAGLASFVAEQGRGLEWEVAELGTNLSVGQRQLLCMARALVRNSKVVVFDEATASLDLETDEQIQRVVRSNFQGATMLIVAHRLQTVIPCDVIAVMDAGRIVEFGSPHELLQRGDGLLARLVGAMGEETAAALRKDAAEAEEARRRSRGRA